MSINIYLHFNGNCREAFELYKSIFGGEFEIFETFAEGPPEMNVPTEEGNNIMHVSYPIGSSVLMGSDTLSMFGPPTEIGRRLAPPTRPKAGRRRTSYLPSFARVGARLCLRPTCFGEVTSAPVPTSSASTGSSTTTKNRPIS